MTGHVRLGDDGEGQVGVPARGHFVRGLAYNVRVDDHAAKVRTPLRNTLPREVSSEYGDESAGDGLTKGGADGFSTVERQPVSCPRPSRVSIIDPCWGNTKTLARYVP